MAHNFNVDEIRKPKPTVYGVGVYERGDWVCSINNKTTKEYNLWIYMLKRCYDKRYKETRPTYLDCCVGANFLNFQYFAEWCNNQMGFNLPDYQLDKDILVKGNKVYSEDTCAFVPRQVNALLIDSKKRRGEYPVGVNYDKSSGKYKAQIRKYGKNHHIGLYSSPEEACAAYKTAKKDYTKDLICLYRDVLDDRVYKALSSWEY